MSPHDEYYEGDWVEGIRHGKGVYHWADGNIYEGDWVDGDFNGNGRYDWANGNW